MYAFKEIIIVEDWEEFSHTLNIVFIMQCQKSVKFFIPGIQVLLVYLNKLAAVIQIISGYSKELFNGLLFAVLKSQNILVG